MTGTEWLDVKKCKHLVTLKELEGWNVACAIDVLDAGINDMLTDGRILMEGFEFTFDDLAENTSSRHIDQSDLRGCENQVEKRTGYQSIHRR